MLNSVINFIDCDISQFEIKYDYQNREITQDKLELKNIYAEKNIYNAEDLNYNFPYYIKIEETDFNAFQYYESEERNAFIDEIISYIDCLINVDRLFSVTHKVVVIFYLK